MKGQHTARVGRRDLLRLAIVGTAAATTGALIPEAAAAAEPTGPANKGKARYQANSAEVKNFYRVNSYPVR
jgi:hypothetical protein